MTELCPHSRRLAVSVLIRAYRDATEERMQYVSRRAEARRLKEDARRFLTGDSALLRFWLDAAGIAPGAAGPPKSLKPVGLPADWQGRLKDMVEQTNAVDVARRAAIPRSTVLSLLRTGAEPEAFPVRAGIACLLEEAG